MNGAQGLGQRKLSYQEARDLVREQSSLHTDANNPIEMGRQYQKQSRNRGPHGLRANSENRFDREYNSLSTND